MPGALSTPLLTSTPNGRTTRIASATFVGIEPARKDQLRAPRQTVRVAPIRGLARAAHAAFEQQSSRQRRPAARDPRARPA